MGWILIVICEVGWHEVKGTILEVGGYTDTRTPSGANSVKADRKSEYEMHLFRVVPLSLRDGIPIPNANLFYNYYSMPWHLLDTATSSLLSYDLTNLSWLFFSISPFLEFVTTRFPIINFSYVTLHIIYNI